MYKLLCCIPGRQDITLAGWRDIYSRLEADRLLPILFYDGGIENFQDFYAFMNSGENWVYLTCPVQGSSVESIEAPLALCWLNGFSGKAALIHFAIFRNGWAEAESIGRFVSSFLLFSQVQAEHSPKDCPKNFQTDHATHCPTYCPTYCLDALYGLTPKPFAHALRYIKRLGFEELAQLPAAACLRRAGGDKITPAVLSLLTRERVLALHSECASTRAGI